MDVSQRLVETLQAFHLDHPQATWSDLREHLLRVAGDLLSPIDDVYSLRDWGNLYRGVSTHSIKTGVAKPLSVDQHEHMTTAKPVIVPTTFEVLSGLYLADRGQDQKASTLKETKICHGTISAALGELDMRTHSRADLVALRDRLADGRMPSTVNKLLIKLSAVLAWSVENGHIPRSYDKKLKLTKGLESNRKAFTQVQVGKLVAYSNTLPETSWKRWLLSLGAITGGRLNEISQLTASDIQTLESGITVIHINESGEGKSIKNKRSERLVPLTDGAYGFDLAAFLRYVETVSRNADQGEPSHSVKLAQIGYKTAGDWANRQAIPEALGDTYGPLASLMQVKGVPTTHAQAVMGHASGTVTFDTYGAGVPVEVIARMLKTLLCPMHSHG
jgi:integrase